MLLRKQIEEMRKVDQALRFKALEEQNKRSSKKTSLGTYNYLVYLADLLHGLKIKEMIKDHGYPNQKKIGQDGMHDFWLLIQHQDQDLLLQKKCLRFCSFSGPDFAHLTDRVLLNSGKKQRYGTQYTGKLDNKGNRILQPLEDPKNLEKRRRSVGM